MNVGEEWRPIVGLEGLYEVSSLGRARSLDRRVLHTGKKRSFYNTHKGKMLKLCDNGAYLQVVLPIKSKNSHQKTITVHSIVAIAFHGPKPDGMVVRHMDGNPRNNAAENLCYGTCKDNEADKYRHGSRGLTEKEPGAILTREQVREIRLLGPYDPQHVLAEHYGVDETLISLILKGKIWREGPSGRPKWQGDGMYEAPLPQAETWKQRNPTSATRHKIYYTGEKL